MKRILFAALFTLIVSTLSFAQSQPPAPQYYRVQTIKLFPGMSDEWRKFYQAEILPALKTGGVKQSSVWSVAVGDVRQYFIITLLDGLTQLDEPGAMAKAVGQEAARALTTKQSRFIAEWQLNITVGRPDLGIAATSMGARKLAVLVTETIAPGRAADYEKWMKEHTLPLVKTAGVKAVLTGRTLLGGDSNEYHVLTLFDSYAEIDKFQASYMKAAAELKLAPGVPPGIFTRREFLVVRYLPELSIAPAPPKPAN